MKYRIEVFEDKTPAFYGQVKFFIWITLKRFTYKQTALEWLDRKKNGTTKIY